MDPSPFARVAATKLRARPAPFRTHSGHGNDRPTAALRGGNGEEKYGIMKGREKKEKEKGKEDGKVSDSFCGALLPGCVPIVRPTEPSRRPHSHIANWTDRESRRPTSRAADIGDAPLSEPETPGGLSAKK